MNATKKIFWFKFKDLISYILYCISILTISYFLDRFYQMLMFILFFSVIQNCFHFRFHADTIIESAIKAGRICKVITLCVEVIYLIFCKPLNISLYSNLFIIFFIAFANCLLEFGLEKFIIKEDCLRNKEKLLELCKRAKLSKIATNRMVLKYIEHKTYAEIAEIDSVEVESIKMSIVRSRKRIFKDQD